MNATTKIDLRAWDPTYTDEILEELYEAKRKINAEANYDIKTLVVNAKKAMRELYFESKVAL